MSSCDGKVKASARGGNPPYTLTIGFPVTISVTSNVSCHGGSDASATGSASGGSNNYTSYSWKKNGTQVSTSQDPTGLSAGTYTLTVTDSNGVQGSSSVEITQPDALSITSSKTDVAIAGGSTGAIDLTVSGGTAPYTYSWSSGQATQDISNLAAGNYTVTVTDKNGCTDTHPVTIDENSVITVSASVNTHVLCYGDSNGSAIGSASGGSGTYVGYSWKEDGVQVSTDQNPDDLPEGTYTLTVTDSVGATGTSSAITISQPDPLEATVTTTVPVTTSNLGLQGTMLQLDGVVYRYHGLWSYNGVVTTQPVTKDVLIVSRVRAEGHTQTFWDNRQNTNYGLTNPSHTGTAQHSTSKCYFGSFDSTTKTFTQESQPDPSGNTSGNEIGNAYCRPYGDVPFAFKRPLIATDTNDPNYLQVPEITYWTAQDAQAVNNYFGTNHQAGDVKSEYYGTGIDHYEGDTKFYLGCYCRVFASGYINQKDIGFHIEVDSGGLLPTGQNMPCKGMTGIVGEVTGIMDENATLSFLYAIPREKVEWRNANGQLTVTQPPSAMAYGGNFDINYGSAANPGISKGFLINLNSISPPAGLPGPDYFGWEAAVNYHNPLLPALNAQENIIRVPEGSETIPQEAGAVNVVIKTPKDGTHGNNILPVARQPSPYYPNRTPRPDTGIVYNFLNPPIPQNPMEEIFGGGKLPTFPMQV